MATSSILTLRNVQLKVVGRELIQALLELRGSGWFCFRLWCLIGRRKTIISGFVLEGVPQGMEEDQALFRRLQKRLSALTCLSHTCAKQGQT